MSRIRSGNTKPEMIVRSLLHSMGYRFRLHGRVSKKYYKKGILPGKPDIVLAKYKTVIFVHGCFWHRHEGCKRATLPKSNKGYWNSKLKSNILRDDLNEDKLKSMGWCVIIVWECETRDFEKLENKIIKISRRNIKLNEEKYL